MSERIDELTQAWLDGDLDAAEIAEIRVALADPQMLARVTAHVREHQLLRGALRSDPASAARRVAAVIAARERGRPGSSRMAVIRARIGAPSAWRWMAAAAVLAIAVGVAAWTLVPWAAPAQVVVAEATAGSSLVRDGSRIALVPGLALRPQDRLEIPAIPADGAVAVRYADGSHLTVHADAAVRLWDADGAKRVALERGEVRGDIAPQPAGKAMRLSAPQAEAEVVGTRFSLVAADGVTRLAVSEGTVSLRRVDGSVSLVHAGGSAEAGANATEPAPRALLDFDFEDGARPPEAVVGRVETGPARAGNRGCITGVLDGDSRFCRVMLDAGEGATLFVFEDGLELRFDYWIDGGAASLDAYVWDDTQQDSFGSRDRFAPVPAARTWASATMRLDEWRTPDGRRLRAGDRIRQLTIQPGSEGGVLHLDNLTLVRPPGP